jgi:hypothetical protein
MVKRQPPLLQLETRDEAAVVLRRQTRERRVSRLPQLLLWPLASGYLRSLAFRSSWSNDRLTVRDVRFGAAGIEVELELWSTRAHHRLTIARSDIESLYFRLEDDAERGGVVLAMYLHHAAGARLVEGRLRCLVDGVDDRKEAMGLVFAVARALACDRYRVRREAERAVELELVTAAPLRAAGGYRTSAAVDLLRVPAVDEDFDQQVRRHAGFVEVEGQEGRRFDASAESGLTVKVYQLGEHVVLGERAQPWRLLLLPLVPLVWIIAWLVLSIAYGFFLGIVVAVLALVVDPFGVDLWVILQSDLTFGVLNLFAALLSLSYVLAPARAMLQRAFGTQVEFDWRSGRLVRRSIGSRTELPMSHIDGVALRGGENAKRLYLQLHDGDLPVARGGDQLAALAVELARALDVPVSLPLDKRS